MPRPSAAQKAAKRAKLLPNDSDSEIDDSASDVNLDGPGHANGFRINEEYANRFEHNKKREERHRLEEKFGDSGIGKRKRGDVEEEEEDSDDESTDESEDDDAELVTADLDEEISATLRAIKNKDPRVYDEKVKFYRELDADALLKSEKSTNDKPMYLQDYHRENLLAGRGALDDEEDTHKFPPTYQEEQDALKRDLVGSLHAVTNGNGGGEDEEGDFLVAKSRPKHDRLASSKRDTAKITEDDVKAADQDPETYLSNFMAARAWLPTENSRFQAFESDDSEEDARADAYETAYNLRFEDPNKANETLKSFARDVGKYGLRRDDLSGRKKAREREREKKEAAKHELEMEKAQLRKLRIEDAEEKVQRIKDAAGMRGQEVDLNEWQDIIEGDFDDIKWEQEMKRRFGEDYYAAGEGETGSNDDAPAGKKRNFKKPMWDDDIDIDDLVPDFDKSGQPNVALSSDSEDGGIPVPKIESDDEAVQERAKKSKKDHLKEKADAKRTARKERAKIEAIVDSSLPLRLATASTSKGPSAGFRYRQTSPTSFGMTARDILFANDAQLNEFAGLKKMAAFRDPEKKRRDNKKFSKKAKLKQWRKETFGDAEEPSGGFERVLGGGSRAPPEKKPPVDGDAGDQKKKKRRRKKAKTEDATT